MQTRNLLTILSILSAGLAIYIGCSNLAPVSVSGFGAAMPIPLGVVSLATYCLGLVTVGSFWATKKQRELSGEKKKVEWANQDVKLMNEIASDQVKLLEAKIATLEVALKSALKKKEG